MNNEEISIKKALKKKRKNSKKFIDRKQFDTLRKIVIQVKKIHCTNKQTSVQLAVDITMKKRRENTKVMKDNIKIKKVKKEQLNIVIIISKIPSQMTLIPMRTAEKNKK